MGQDRITKWGSFLDYKVGQMDYKVGQGLQSGAGITKWCRDYKVGQGLQSGAKRLQSGAGITK